MKLASYNVENLFMRARAMNGETLAEGKDALTHHAALNATLAKPTYTRNDKDRIVELMTELGIDKKDDGGKYAILRQNRGHLVKRPTQGGVQVVANGRGDWIGWVDLKIEEVNEVATQNTARVINDVAPDVLAVVEAESRPALVRFSDNLLPAVGARSFDSIMLIDGNDDRGIDVGVMTRAGYSIVHMLSHVGDADPKGPIFSRDCPEYAIRTPKGNTVVLLINHLKSKGFGSQGANDAKRARQAVRVKAIYESLAKAGQKHIAVVGDLNDTPDSAPLAALLDKTNLKDIAQHPKFTSDGRPGTYANGTASDKIDYILLSPPLFAAVTRGAVFRKGVWGGKNGGLFPHYAEMTKASEAASDHAAIWADVDV